jgi:hypothetical protein
VSRALVIAAALAAASPASAQTIDRLDAISHVLNGCVGKRLEASRFSGQREATFSVSFQRDGSIIGVPRRSYSFPAADGPEQAEFLAAVANAIMGCAPLPFSKELGEATAGRPFRFRYIIKPSQDRRA